MTKRKRSTRPHQQRNQSADNQRSTPGGKSRNAKSGRERVWLYGAHAVRAALANPLRIKFRLLVSQSEGASLFEDIEDLTIQPETLSRPEMEKLLPPGAVHQGIALQTAPLPATDIEDLFDLQNENAAVVVVLDQVTDPRNIGAVMRSAAAFGAIALVVPDRHTPEATSILAKAASGALDRLPLIRVNNLSRALDQLKEHGFWCVGLDGSGDKTLAETDLGGKTVLIMGAEGKGLRRLTAEKCDFLARIPIDPESGSINVSAAAAIALYEISRDK